MTAYTNFQFEANGTRFPDRVVNVQKMEVVGRSSSGPANLYVQVTGIANFAEDPDPNLKGVQRGILAVVFSRADAGSATPVPILQLGDTMLEASAIAYLRRINREQETESDDFVIALDEVTSVTVDEPTNAIVLSIRVGYGGDVWVGRVGFTVNLLVHRPSVDNVTSDDRVRLALEGLRREFATLGLARLALDSRL
jgi:hypothetical protein